MYILEKDNIILAKGFTVKELIFNQKHYKIDIKNLTDTVEVTISSNLNYITFKPFIFSYVLYSEYTPYGFKSDEIGDQIVKDFLNRVNSKWFTIYKEIEL